MDSLDKLKLLYDIEVRLSLILGVVDKNIEYILNIKEGDVIELNKNIEDYLDINLEGEPFGKGELVIVNDRFSFRLIDLVK